MTTKPLTPEQIREAVVAAISDRMWISRETAESIFDGAVASLPNTDVQGVSEGCRRWIESKNNCCFEPARYIVWGKLFPPEHLGPRCSDCFADEHPEIPIYRLDQYAVFDLASLPASQETVSEKRCERCKVGAPYDPEAGCFLCVACLNGAPDDGATLIAVERRRQRDEIEGGEGWDEKHDDTHDQGELVAAAIVYANPPLGSGWGGPGCAPPDWPWEPESYKPKDQVSNLVRAGALLAAEIDRLQRRAD